MEGYDRGVRKIAVTDQELNRQYSLVKQTLTMHHMLKDRYRRLSLLCEISLMVASVVFLATTFADSSLYDTLNIEIQAGKVILGLASVAAFSLSLSLMALDWSGKAAIHKDSANRWFQTLALYRESRFSDGTWSDEFRDKLSQAYADVCNNTVDIPESLFITLKVRYNTKLRMSKLASKYPAAPAVLIWFCIKISAIHSLLTNYWSQDRSE